MLRRRLGAAIGRDARSLPPTTWVKPIGYVQREPGPQQIFGGFLISRKELNPHAHSLTPEQEANQTKLHVSVNLLRGVYGKPMLVTSGVRSMEQHLAIYKKLGRQAPKGSAHLTGAAVDFADRDGALARWCVDHVADLQKWGLYMEDPSATSGWVHLQCTPPASGNTIFVPYIKAAKR